MHSCCVRRTTTIPDASGVRGFHKQYALADQGTSRVTSCATQKSSIRVPALRPCGETCHRNIAGAAAVSVAADGTPKVRQTLGRQAGSAAFWNTALLPLRLGANLLAQILLANALVPTAFGVYALTLSVGVTCGIFVDLGTERSIVKFLPEVAARAGHRGARRLIRWVLGVKTAVLAPFILLAIILHGAFFRYIDSRVSPGKPDVAALVQRQHWILLGVVLALVFIGAYFDVAMQSLVGTLRNKSWNLITVGVTVVDPIVVSLIVLAGGSIVAILAGRVMTALVALLGATAIAVIAVRQSVEEEQASPATGESAPPLVIRRFAAYSALQYGLQITAFLTSYAFASLILTNADDIAGYRIANGTASTILRALITPIVGLQVPVFARIFARQNAGQLQAAYGLVARFLALLLIPAAVGLAILMPNLFRILYPQFEAVAPLGIVIVLLSFTESALSTGETVLLTFERYRPVLAARAVAFLALPLMLITVPRFGPMGAALTGGGCAVLAAVIGTFAATRLLPLRYPLAFVRRVAMATAAMAVVVGVLGNTLARVPADAGNGGERILWLAVTGGVAVVGAAAYLLVFRRMGGIDPEDRTRLESLRLPLRGLTLRLLTGGRADR
jgi:O-antigen/teichoic acid export membrane protein